MRRPTCIPKIDNRLGVPVDGAQAAAVVSLVQKLQAIDYSLFCLDEHVMREVDCDRVVADVLTKARAAGCKP